MPLHPWKILTIFLLFTASLAAQADDNTGPPISNPLPRTASPKLCSHCIHAHMEFLASDALRGRGSGTPEEWIAATYVAAQLEQYGVEPAGDKGTFIQRGTLLHRKLASPATITLRPGAGAAAPEITWTQGKEIIPMYLGKSNFSGPLQKIHLSGKEKPKVQPGAVVFLTADKEDKYRQAAFQLSEQGAAAVLIPADKRARERWDELGKKLAELPPELEGGVSSSMMNRYAVFALNEESAKSLAQIPDATAIRFQAELAAPEKTYTWNALGIIHGSDRALSHAALLLSAHLDHLGLGKAVDGDNIYNGADDDASGTTAVLEFARVLAGQSKPRRTVVFALFGSEEAGALGSTYFLEHPPIPLKDIAANLEFEMIGRADDKVAPDANWLTGWERSDLGPTLASHGARLVADPHPTENFFGRSDNIVLAKKGVVAQTVSSFGLHKDYHQPSDDLAHIDFKHMDEAIGSMLKPLLWLVNSDFSPKWNKGQQP